MKVVMCGIGKEAKRYFEQYEIRVDQIACMVDKRPDRANLTKDLEILPFITWDELRGCDRCSEAEARFVICTGKYYHEILNEIKKIFGEQVNVVGIDEYVHIEDWKKKEARELEIIFQNIVPIPAECLEGASVLADREAVLQRVPQGGIAAEIGVATGYFSRKILENIKPEKFYAVDMFSDERTEYFGVEFGPKKHFGWYKEAFAKEIESGLLEMRRGISWEAIAEFPDDYFDYVYVDAGHDYPSVKKDVESLVPKVKNGGVIQFNDYAIYNYSVKVPYGIVPVVNKLVNDTHSEVLYYCLSTNGLDDIVIRLRK